MKIKQTIIIAALALTTLLGAVTSVNTVSAECDSSTQTCCGDVAVSILGGSACDNVKADSGELEETGLWSILLLVINIMTAGVGVLAVGGIVYGAILYTSAGGNSEQVKKAMGIITNVAIGLLAYALMYAILNFIIPGGLFA